MTSGQWCALFAKSLIIVLGLLSSQSARATLLFSEAFNYSPGALQNQVNPGNSATWTGGNSGLTIVSTNLTYPNLADQGGNSLQVSNASAGSSIIQYANQTSGKVYYSFLFNPTVTNSGNTYFTALNPGTTSPGGSGDAVNAYYYSNGKIYVRGGGASASAGTGTALTIGTTYLIVISVDLDTKVDSLWINPDSSTFGGTEPTPTATVTGTSQTAVDNVGFKAQSGSGTYFVDNLLIGTTWADVTPSSTCVSATVTDPANASVEAGSPATFTVSAGGSSVDSYQWQYSTDGNDPWLNVSGGSGGNTPSYTTDPTDVSQNGYQYRCVADASCNGSSATSSVPAILTVTCNPPGFTTDPVDVSLSAGATTNFSVVATGSSPTYQWEVSTDGGANFYPDYGSYGTGFDTNVYTLYPTYAAENNYQFRCVIYVDCDSLYATSQVATLTVNCSTANITSDPVDQAVLEGSTAKFVVGTDGSNPDYQWELSIDGGSSWNTVGTSTNTYVTPATTSGDQGNQYRCVVHVPCDDSYKTSSVATLTVAAPGSVSFRSAASGDWSDTTIWQLSADGGANWYAAGFTPTSANATSILISSGTTVTITNSDTTVDDTVVAASGDLVIGSNRKLIIADGAGTDLAVFGTVENISTSGSALTLNDNASMVVQSGGVLVENGTSSGWVNAGTGSAISFAAAGKFQLVKSGGRIPLATWDPASTCEIAYTADGSKPDTSYLSQDFGNFVVNCPLNTSGWDLAGKLLNVHGDLAVTLGAYAGAVEFKLFSGSANSGNLNIGGNFIINSGRFNVASSGGPWSITLTSNMVVAAGASIDVSGSSSASYTMIINGTGTQNYTCDGDNTAIKLNWTVNGGSTLNLNSDLPLHQGGRTLTADGTVNLNGHALLTDLLAGSGTVQNEGGGAGLLVLGAGGGDNALLSAPLLADGASGTLGLANGNGTLTIYDTQTFTGGLVVSNGTVLVNNTAGSGTGSGDVTVAGGTLGGNGTIAGSVTVEGGGNLAPGNSLEDLTINGELTLGGTFTAEVNTGASPNTDRVLGTSAVNYGGTLEIVNQGSPLTTSDTFQIFPAGTKNGGFTVVPANPDNDTGLAWDTTTLITDGTLRITTAVVSSPILETSQSGNTLTFSWSGAGYKLQSQTNVLSQGLSTNPADWHDYPGGDVSPVDATIDPANPAVFFRLSQ